MSTVSPPTPADPHRASPSTTTPPTTRTPQLLAHLPIHSLFTPSETALLPRHIDIAIQRAEHSRTVRQQLHRLQKVATGQQDGDASTRKGRRSARRMKYGKVLGQLGYEQLVLKPLAVIDQVKYRRPPISVAPSAAAPSVAYAPTAVGKPLPTRSETLNACLKRLVGQMEKIPWLDKDEKEAMTNVFITEMAIRHNELQDLPTPGVTGPQRRILGVKVFEHMAKIRDGLLEKCRRLKEKMEQAGMFRKELNDGRLEATFRLKLCRGIHTQDLVKQALTELEGGEIILTPMQQAKIQQDQMKLELLEFKETLDRITHPTPTLHPPTLISKHQPAVLRSLMREREEALHNLETTTPRKPSLPTDRRVSILAQRRLTALQMQMPDFTLPVHHRSAQWSGGRSRPGSSYSRGGIREEEWEDEEEDEDGEGEGEEGEEFEFSEEEGDWAAGLVEGEDPILSAHTQLSVYRREREVKPEDSSRAPVTLRALDSKVSARVPKGFIDLSAEPASAVGEFDPERSKNQGVTDDLDEKLTRFKEVEELYDAIMKTIKGNHLDTDQGEEDINATPAAPYDPVVPLSYAFQRVTPPSLLPVSRPTTAPTTAPTSQPGRPTIRLLTRDATRPTLVSPDDFTKNRHSAMQKTPSSRYGALRYNYGGYIPFDLSVLSRKRIQKRPPISVEDYLSHLRAQRTDFVSGLLMRVDEDAERIKKEREEEERVRNEEEERRRKESEEEEKQEKRRRLLAFERGVWNPGILEFMAELREAERVGEGDGVAGLELVVEEKGGGGVEDEGGRREQAESGERSMLEEESLLVKTPLSVSPLRMTPVTPSLLPDAIDIRKSQEELERLWVTLKMPLDQKLDMAIKYGSHKFAPKLGTVSAKKGVMEGCLANPEIAMADSIMCNFSPQAIKLWKEVSEHIIAREALLVEIEMFEQTASDPERFFRKGYEGSSEARMKEAREREELMRRLHYVEARIQESVRTIKRELHESVTYEGVSLLRANALALMV
ncbi:Coiled-coil domain-containing protein 87 [Rhizophlyctis rosea]|nr:Coiled-coil domain-containing protein 87 [Rhizophlyctis rosea]